MRLLRFLRSSGTWSIEDLGRPWGAQPSLHSFLLAHGADREEGLGTSPPDLPDEGQDRPLRFGPGALEGTTSHHVGSVATAEVRDDGDTPEQLAARVVYCLEQALESSEPEKLSQLCEELVGEDTLTALDAILEQLARAPLAHPERARALARFLATEAADRNPVKLGMALLGVVGAEEDIELLLTLGRHDELTLVAVVALQHLAPNPEAATFRLAKAVHGWGRVHAVERLAEARSPEIRRWLLLEGYKNSVLIEYSALIAAKTGRLTAALADGPVEPQVLVAGGEILEALIRGVDGPAEGIDQWEEGARAVELWLRALGPTTLTPRLLAAVKTVLDFIRDEDEPWSEYAEHGWTAERIQAIERHASSLLALPEAHARVEAALATAQGPDFLAAVTVASVVGVDAWPTLFGRLGEGEDRWELALRTPDWARAEQLVALAEEVLPLEEIARGAGLESGFENGFAAHRQLDALLQGLQRFPGLGWSLVSAGLKSPVIGNRKSALRALATWGSSRWAAEVRPTLERAVFAEPDETVKECLKRLLAGRPLEAEP